MLFRVAGMVPDRRLFSKALIPMMRGLGRQCRKVHKVQVLNFAEVAIGRRYRACEFVIVGSASINIEHLP